MNGILDFLTSPGFAQGLSIVGKGLSAMDRGRSPDFTNEWARIDQMGAQNKLNTAKDNLLRGGILRQMLEKQGIGPEAYGVLSNALEAAPGAVLPQLVGMAFPKTGDPYARYKVVGNNLVDLAGPGGPAVAIAGREGGGVEDLALHKRAIAAGLTPGTDAYNQFMLNGGVKKNARIVYGPDGNPIFYEGPAGGEEKPLREFEAKAVQFYKRMSDSLPRVEKAENALMGENGGPSMLDTFADNFGSAGNFIKSKEYQTYQAAAREWIAGLLRLDSGAAVPESEFQRYFSTYFFAPGDNEQTREAKRQARITAMEALKGIQPPGREGAAPSARKPLSEMSDEELKRLYGGN